MYVCVRVCMCVCVGVCVNVFAYVCVCVCVHVFAHVWEGEQVRQSAAVTSCSIVGWHVQCA